MNPFPEFETDPSKERDGVPVIVKSRQRPEDPGMTFILRRAGGANRRYRYALAHHMQKMRDEFKDTESLNGQLRAFSAEDEAAQEAFADAVIIGWDGIEGRDGSPLEFTRENALDLIRHCPEVWDELRVAAVDNERFRPNGAAEDGVAVGKLSAGASNGDHT